MNNMPVPYNGNEKYIFVSYSHKDSDTVLPVINRMIAKGYRVWFDQGIDPGSEWDENIAQHINNCGYFAAFMSESYLASGNCCDELSYARDLDKDRLVVYLEQVDLPSGIAMRINRIQSIYMYKYTDSEMFYNKLFSTQNIDVCMDSDSKMSEKPESENIIQEKSDDGQKTVKNDLTESKPDAEKEDFVSDKPSADNEPKKSVALNKANRVVGLVAFISSVFWLVLSFFFIDAAAIGFIISVLSTICSFLTFAGILTKKVLRIINHVVFGLNLFIGIICAAVGMGGFAIFYGIVGILLLIPLWVFLNIKKYKK